MKTLSPRTLAARFLPLTLIATALTFSSCADPNVPFKDELGANQITVESGFLNTMLVVEKPIVTRVAGGALDVVIKVRNMTGDDVYLQYSGHFVDSHNLETGLAYNSVRFTLRGRDIYPIHITSTGPQAADFRVRIECALGNACARLRQISALPDDRWGVPWRHPGAGASRAHEVRARPRFKGLA